MRPNLIGLVSLLEKEEATGICMHKGKVSEKVSVYKPERKILPETNSAGTLTLDFKPPEPWENWSRTMRKLISVKAKKKKKEKKWLLILQTTELKNEQMIWINILVIR